MYWCIPWAKKLPLNRKQVKRVFHCVVLAFLCVVTPSMVAAQTSAELEAEQRSWLAQHLEISLGVTRSSAPVEFIDPHEAHSGATAAYAALLSASLGFEFEIKSYSSNREVVTAGQKREIDCWMKSSGDDETMLVTKPYLTIPIVVVVPDTVTGTISLEDAQSMDMSIAVVDGSVAQGNLRETFPDLHVITVPDVARGLDKVSFGSADAMVVNLAAANYFFDKKGIANLRIGGESGFAWPLAIGCREDWPQLIGIMQHGLDSISVEQQGNIYRQWVASDHKAKPTALSKRTIATGVVLVAFLILVALGLIRRSRRRSPAGQETSWMSGLTGGWPVYCIAIAAISTIAGGAFWGNSVVTSRAHGDVANALTTVVDTSSKAVNDWLGERTSEITRWTIDGNFGQAAASAVNASKGMELQTQKDAADDFRDIVSPLMRNPNYRGFALLSPDGLVLAGTAEGVLAPGQNSTFTSTLAAEVASASSHRLTRLPRRATDSDQISPMVIAVGVRLGIMEVGAVLVVEIDPALSFSSILQRGRIGTSGETYAFNRDGLLVSMSRFDEQLRAAGLFGAREHSILRVQLRDPGGNVQKDFKPNTSRNEMPLTQMASRAIKAGNGSDLKGYRDYRGVPVVGAWVWDEDLGLGIATEMDVEDAYAFLHSYQRLIWWGTALSAILIFALTIVFVWNRAKLTGTNQALHQAYEIIKGHKERMEHELNVGRDIQMSMVPLTFPAFPSRDEFSIHASLLPAREVGGDFYDFFFIDEHRLCFVIGDVSGKGVPAALFMAVTRTVIKSVARTVPSPAAILTQVNEELSENNESCMFVTLFSGVLDLRTGRITYTNAGHNPPLIKRADGSLSWLDDRHGPVVGAMEGLTYKGSEMVMEPGDLLLTYTDGVTEAMDEEQRLFSDARLFDLLDAAEDLSAEQAVDHVVAAVRDFEPVSEQADDITVLALAFHRIATFCVETTMKIDIAKGLSELVWVQERFDTFCGEIEGNKKVIGKMHVALDELLNNVISYSGDDGPGNPIKLTLQRDEQKLIARIADQGKPFNPLERTEPNTDASIEDRKIGGLGIHLVRNMIDEVAYERTNGRNVVTLTNLLENSVTES
jgi:sigma-B regulation protein RsbU (phosphoserine phosphatase)